MDYKGIEYLRNKLSLKKGRVKLRYEHYEMKHRAMDFRISTPPELQFWMGVLGWCGKAVDSLADRLVFNRFENDTMDMGGIFTANNKDVLIDSAILGALISSCDFIYITADSDGYPQMRVIDGAHATGIIDPITNMLKEGYAVIEYNGMDEPIIEGYFTAESTTVTFVISETGRAPADLAAAAISRCVKIRASNGMITGIKAISYELELEDSADALTYAEAKAKLLANEYCKDNYDLTEIPQLTESDIAGCTLVYKGVYDDERNWFAPGSDKYVPYYCFYVTADANGNMTKAYVCALK